MGVSFVEAIGQDPHRASIVDTMEFLIGNELGVLLMVGEVGMVGGIATPDFFNRNKLGAAELFWWVDEEARGSGAGVALLNGLESWAISIGASRLSMTAWSPCLERLALFMKSTGIESSRPLT